MKLSKNILIAGVVIGVLFAAAVTIYAAPRMTVTLYASEQYNRFLVADLGLSGSAKNMVFEVTFDPGDTTDKYYVNIVVKDEITGQTLISGNTNALPTPRILAAPLPFRGLRPTRACGTRSLLPVRCRRVAF